MSEVKACVAVLYQMHIYFTRKKVR